MDRGAARDGAFERLAAPIASEALRLVPLSEVHLVACDRAFRSDDELWTWTLEAQPRSQTETTGWFERTFTAANARERCTFAIELPTGAIAGTTSFLDIRPADGGVEIGWTHVFASYRRTFVNTAAKLAMLTRAFETGFERVSLETDSRDARSRAAIERIGATYEGTLRSYQRRHDGTLRDTALYSIVAAEWPRVRAALTDALARSADAG